MLDTEIIIKNPPIIVKILGNLVYIIKSIIIATIGIKKRKKDALLAPK